MYRSKPRITWDKPDKFKTGCLFSSSKTKRDLSLVRMANKVMQLNGEGDIQSQQYGGGQVKWTHWQGKIMTRQEVQSDASLVTKMGKTSNHDTYKRRLSLLSFWEITILFPYEDTSRLLMLICENISLWQSISLHLFLQGSVTIAEYYHFIVMFKENPLVCVKACPITHWL